MENYRENSARFAGRHIIPLSGSQLTSFTTLPFFRLHPDKKNPKKRAGGQFLRRNEQGGEERKTKKTVLSLRKMTALKSDLCSACETIFALNTSHNLRTEFHSSAALSVSSQYYRLCLSLPYLCTIM